MASTALRLSSILIAPTSFARTSLQLQCASKIRSSARSARTRAATQSPGPYAQERESRSSTQRSLAPQRRYNATGPTTSASASAFQSPPVYTPPSAGILSHLPAPWILYAELIRLDKPTGTTYLFLPCLFSTLLSAPLATPITPPSTLLSTAALFYAGALIMRGAGCTINDLWDRDLDPKVERTRLRPIARGAVTVRQAVVFLGAQLVAGLGVLLCFPSQCLWYGIPSLLLVGTYPLAKRVTNYPQFVLGLTFSWGAIMGFPALGIDLLSNTSALVSAGCLYASCVAWTVVYDMIYAYQDIRDDAVAGIKSIALAQHANAKIFLSSVAAVQVVTLAAAGAAVGAGPVYFVGTCGGAAATLGYMIRSVDLGSVHDCWGWFKKGAWFTGGAISISMLAEYFSQYLGSYEASKEVETT